MGSSSGLQRGNKAPAILFAGLFAFRLSRPGIECRQPAPNAEMVLAHQVVNLVAAVAPTRLPTLPACLRRGIHLTPGTGRKGGLGGRGRFRKGVGDWEAEDDMANGAGGSAPLKVLFVGN